MVLILLGLSLAATVLVFAVSDSLTFTPLPYDDADRIVVIQEHREGGAPPSAFLSPSLLDAWRAQTDLFERVHGYLEKNIFLTGEGVPELVPAADVTPGLIDLLGGRPGWGRPLLAGDERQSSPHVALVSESLARARFGEPARAVGRSIGTTGEPLQIVGVMPRGFRFPSSRAHVWRAMDPRGPLAIGVSGVHTVAKLRSGLTTDAASAAVQRRGEIVASAAAAGASRFDLVPWAPRTPVDRTMLLVLLGAAGCLLLTVCVNVASLELAVVLQRARTYAIQLSLGASRAQLCRTVLSFAIAMAGVYAAMAFLVTVRRREIGVRIALGARKGHVGRLVLGSAVRLTAVGAAIGVVAAIGASRWIESQLFAVEPADPATMTIVSIAPLVTAVMAAWPPARRAMRIEPIEALRSQ